MASRSYADPTAWKAIANTDRKPRKIQRAALKQHQDSQRVERVGVWRDPEAKTLDQPAVVFRPENQNVFLRLKKISKNYNLFSENRLT